MASTGRRSCRPPRANSGSTSCETFSDVSATSRRRAGDVRNRRGRLTGNPGKVISVQSKFECGLLPAKNQRMRDASGRAGGTPSPPQKHVFLRVFVCFPGLCGQFQVKTEMPNVGLAAAASRNRREEDKGHGKKFFWGRIYSDLVGVYLDLHGFLTTKPMIGSRCELTRSRTPA